MTKSDKIYEKLSYSSSKRSYLNLSGIEEMVAMPAHLSI